MTLTNVGLLIWKGNLQGSRRTMNSLKPGKNDQTIVIFVEQFTVLVLIFSCFVTSNRMQVHFENIQRIADTTTLPHAMHYLSCRIAEDLDLSHLTVRLMKAKGQPNSLSSSDKLKLWDRLKILSMKPLPFGFLVFWCFEYYKLQVSSAMLVNPFFHN